MTTFPPSVPPSVPQPHPAPPEGFNFTSAPALSVFQVSPPAFLSTRHHFAAVASGALVFTRSPAASPSSASSSAGDHQDRVLLVQRATHDSMPCLWESPGGACDDDDVTILHGVARELWEESGLRLRNVVRMIPMPGRGIGPEDRDGGAHVFCTRRGLRVGKFNFEVEVEVEVDGPDAAPRVVLDPNEHQSFVWAAEEECREGKIRTPAEDGSSDRVVEVKFTTEEQREIILEAFRLRREEA